MNIELTNEQAQAVATQGDAFVVIDPNTKYDVFARYAAFVIPSASFKES